MSDDKPVEIPSTFLELLKNTFDGGALRVITSKPVEQAIGRLISGIVDIPGAYLESIGRNIRREAEAKDKIYVAIANAAAASAANDKELIDRSIDRWARQLTSK